MSTASAMTASSKRETHLHSADRDVHLWPHDPENQCGSHVSLVERDRNGNWSGHSISDPKVPGVSHLRGVWRVREFEEVFASGGRRLDSGLHRQIHGQELL